MKRVPLSFVVGMLCGIVLTYAASHAAWYWTWLELDRDCQRGFREAVTMAEECAEHLTICEQTEQASLEAIQAALAVAMDAENRRLAAEGTGE